MEITQEQIEKAGFSLQPAPADAWRNYDERHPVPNYFDFDWLSARHPDLYHKFALSSTGLANKLDTLIDLTGLEVVDICAGTGRITQEVAKKAKKVTAVDAYAAVVAYGNRLVAQAGLKNVTYVRGDTTSLPLADNSCDAATCAWGFIHYPEAYRVLKPGGSLIDLIPAPGALCGELTPVLAEVYPHLITEIAPAEKFDPSYPEIASVLQADTWNGVPITPPILVHEFTYVADYGDCAEAAAMIGRLYGPKAKHYMLDNQKASVSWRLQVVINRVRK